MSVLLYTCYSNVDSANFAINTQYTGGFPIRGGFKDLEDAKSICDSPVIVVIEIKDGAIEDGELDFPDNMEIYKSEDVLSVKILEEI
jgi:hypothetical protein